MRSRVRSTTGGRRVTSGSASPRPPACRSTSSSTPTMRPSTRRSSPARRSVCPMARPFPRRRPPRRRPLRPPAPATAPAATPAPTKPVTTAAPTTTAKPVVTYPTISAAAAAQIIRDVWPDELEGRAIEIATRESSLVVTAQNSCCYGLFQINWEPHKAGSPVSGSRSPDQLFDAADERRRRVCPVRAIGRLGSVDLNPVGNGGLSP